MEHLLEAQPEVSIIMPAYNAEDTLQASIDSVLTQTYQNWELIIVDDASTDRTAEVARAINDKRVHFSTNIKNQGVAFARNAGLKKVKGNYIAFLDSDDLWHEQKLDKQVRFMNETNAVISFTGTSYMNATGQISKYVLQAKNDFTYKELLRRNIMSCSSVMVQRDSMIPFSQGYMHEDYAVWLQIVRKTGQAYGLDEPLLIYRMTKKSKSAKRLSSLKMIWGSYKHVGYGNFASTFLMCRYILHSIPKRTKIKLGIRREYR